MNGNLVLPLLILGFAYVLWFALYLEQVSQHFLHWNAWMHKHGGLVALGGVFAVISQIIGIYIFIDIFGWLLGLLYAALFQGGVNILIRLLIAWFPGLFAFSLIGSPIALIYWFFP